MYRDKIIAGIREIIGEDLLAKALIKDEMANGVQFTGKEQVSTVALGVSLNEDFLKEAVRIGAEMVVVHHGFDARTYKSVFSKSAQKRLKIILDNRLTVVGLHYALDAHPRVGNNAVIIRELGASLGEPLFEEWGYVGKFDQAQEVEKLTDRCRSLFNHEILAINAGPEKVTTIGVVSGAGKPNAMHMAELEQKGIELFITGEPAESVPHLMKEAEINYFAGGHYATEVFGVQALAKQIKLKFKHNLKLEFIDIANAV